MDSIWLNLRAAVEARCTFMVRLWLMVDVLGIARKGGGAEQLLSLILAKPWHLTWPSGCDSDSYNVGIATAGKVLTRFPAVPLLL
jgi:hypothetical protein